MARLMPIWPSSLSAGRRCLKRSATRRNRETSSTTTLCRMPLPKRPSRNSPGCRRRHTASKNRSSAARAKRVWPTIKFAIGWAGITIKCYLCWPCGFWCSKLVGEKKWTPAITVPQIREALSTLTHHAWKCHMQQQIVRERERKLRRNELARFYHYKARKKLAPLRLTQKE